MRSLTSRDQAEALLRDDLALLLKYGTHCAISAAARDEVEAVSRREKDAKFYLLAVDEERELSNFLAERLAVTHASPQAFVLCNGEVVWHATHFDITQKVLTEQLSSARRATSA